MEVDTFISPILHNVRRVAELSLLAKGSNTEKSEALFQTDFCATILKGISFFLCVASLSRVRPLSRPISNLSILPYPLQGAFPLQRRVILRSKMGGGKKPKNTKHINIFLSPLAGQSSQVRTSTCPRDKRDQMAMLLWNLTDNGRFVPGTDPGLFQGGVPFVPGLVPLCPEHRPRPKCLCLLVFGFFLPHFLAESHQKKIPPKKLCSRISQVIVCSYNRCHCSTDITEHNSPNKSVRRSRDSGIQLGHGRNAVSRVLFRRRQLTEPH